MGTTPTAPASTSGQAAEKQEHKEEPLFEHGRMVTFSKRHIQPPSMLYFTPDDALGVTVVCTVPNTQLAITGRILQPDGTITPFQETFTPPTADAVDYLFYTLTEGFLLSLTVETTLSDLARGQCYVLLSIARGNNDNWNSYGDFLCGYVDDTNGLSWPPGQHEEGLSGIGYSLLDAPADPVAGALYTYTVPGDLAMKLRSAVVELATSATVADRAVYIDLIDSTGKLKARAAVNTTQAASLNYEYFFGLNGSDSPGAAVNNVLLARIPELILFGGDQIKVNVANIDAADQLSNIALSLEQWIAMQSV